MNAYKINLSNDKPKIVIRRRGQDSYELRLKDL
jgi:hypothetical protein